MITENLSTLKIHKLTQEQYDRELAAGRIDANALYLTPDEKAPQSNWSQNDTSALDYIKNRTHYTEKDQDGSEIVHKLDEKYIPDSIARTTDVVMAVNGIEPDDNGNVNVPVDDDVLAHMNNKSNPHNVTLAQLGITATAEELNNLNGMTANSTELNAVKGVTGNIQSQIDGITSKVGDTSVAEQINDAVSQKTQVQIITFGDDD